MRLFYKRSFLKTFEEKDSFTQKLIVEAHRQIKDYLAAGQAPYGLRIKKISAKSFEARVNDKIRIVWSKKGDDVSFVLIGNHEEVQNYLKNFEV